MIFSLSWVACNGSTSIDPSFERKTWSRKGFGRFHSLRGYSELLGTILQRKKCKNQMFFQCFLRCQFGTNFLVPPRWQQNVKKNSKFFVLNIWEGNVNKTFVFGCFLRCQVGSKIAVPPRWQQNVKKLMSFLTFWSKMLTKHWFFSSGLKAD